MSPARIAKWHPILILGLVSYGVVLVPGLMGWDYDEHLLATIFFLLGQVLGFVFRTIGIGLAAMNGGSVLPNQTLWVSILGLGVYIVADVALTVYARERAGGHRD